MWRRGDIRSIVLGENNHLSALAFLLLTAILQVSLEGSREELDGDNIGPLQLLPITLALVTLLSLRMKFVLLLTIFSGDYRSLLFICFRSFLLLKSHFCFLLLL